jgi:tetratricopeptide (TPR) repeat protein
MATDTAHAFTASSPPRQIWQVPIFLLGAAVLIAVPLTRHYWTTNDEPGLARLIAAARQDLAATPPNTADALDRANKALASADRFPQFAGEAHFLAGSARLLQSTPLDAAAISQVRQHLEQADRLGIPDADRPKLAYRLAKVAVLQGTEGAKATANLSQAIDAADDPAEAYGLLAEAYLKQLPPDQNAALEATQQQLAKAAPASDAAMLAQARLRLGELQLKKDNLKDGRAALDRIGPDAPPEAFFAARALLADSYESTREWTKAARNLEQLGTNSKLAPSAKAAILYRLGRCFVQDQRPDDAARVWAEAVNLGGDEGQAAAWRLAEMKIESDAKAAADSFAVALHSVRAPADYRNPLVSIDDARRLLEKSIQASRGKGDSATTERLVELFARLAPPGRDDELLAQSADANAQSLSEQAQQNPTQAPTLLDQSRGQHLVAARAYERAASRVAPGPEQAQWLWRSADRYLKAQQPQAALDVLTRMTQLEGVLSEENVAEAWYQVATIHHRKQQYAAARAAYQRCLTPPGRFTLSSRHQLALLDLVENKFNEAEQALQDNRTALRAAAQPDAALLEQTEYALAAVAFQRQAAVKEELREYTTAEQRFLGALQQFPESAEAAKAMFHLGQCYWFAASQKSKALGGSTLTDDERRSYFKQYVENLDKSTVQFDKVEAYLLSRANAQPLSKDDETLLWTSSFMAAHGYFHQDKFEEAARRYGILAVRYQGQVLELGALSQIFQCQYYTKQLEKARAAIAKTRAAYEKLPDSAFNGRDEHHQRSFWLKWFTDAEKVLEKSDKAPENPQ